MKWLALITFLASLFNTVALLYWQSANEKRLDIHWETLKKHQTWIKEILPMLNFVSGQLKAWEKWNNERLAALEQSRTESDP